MSNAQEVTHSSMTLHENGLLMLSQHVHNAVHQSICDKYHRRRGASDLKMNGSMLKFREASAFENRVGDVKLLTDPRTKLKHLVNSKSGERRR